MNLFFRQLGKGNPLIIIHGVFGSSDNWISIGRKLSDRFSVFMLDMRNHGQSPHSDEFSYKAMSDDIFEFINEHNLKEINIIGHSMGGKVAMLFASRFSEIVKKLVVVDMAPKRYAPHHKQVFDGLFSLNLNTLNTRSEADKQLSFYINEPLIRQFLLKNLYRKKDNTFNWRLNLTILKDNIDNMDEININSNNAFLKPTLFIKGEKSNYILPFDESSIKTLFPNAVFVSISNAGHWVHAEQPEEFLKTITNFLN